MKISASLFIISYKPALRYTVSLLRFCKCWWQQEAIGFLLKRGGRGGGGGGEGSHEFLEDQHGEGGAGGQDGGGREVH